jgi:SAM-dependent methyltransferase
MTTTRTTPTNGSNGHSTGGAHAPSAQKGGHGATGFFQLLKERRTRDALYHDANYWDARASARGGLARSIWPSNVYNEYWDARQRELLVRTLEPSGVRDRRVVDVGCGTGRMTRFFASFPGGGAKEVVGVDFSPSTVESARQETKASATENADRARFVVGDVVAGLDELGVGTFDDAIVLGCLSVACRDLPSLERAMNNVARLVHQGGRVLILEPIHRSPLLRRVLDLGLEDWIGVANRAGLALTKGDRMGFFPVRLVFSVRDLPRAVVGPIFRAGERLLDAAPYLAPLSDYKLLLFRKA